MTAQTVTGSTPLWGDPRKRFFISCLLIGHVVAVVVAPLAFQTRGPRGSSPSVETLAAPVRGYGEFLYLNRGYAFFAPDPGPSHLFQVAIDDPKGDADRQEIVFPDLDQQWPRLRYHRHFMLAEYLTEIYYPPGPPEPLVQSDPEAARLWEQLRGRYEHVRQSYVRHLQSKYPGRKVALRRLEHGIPDFAELDPGPLDLRDPSRYRVMLDQSMEEPNPLADGPPTELLPPSSGRPETDSAGGTAQP